MKTNLTQFEWVKTELKQRKYDLNKQVGQGTEKNISIAVIPPLEQLLHFRRCQAQGHEPAWSFGIMQHSRCCKIHVSILSAKIESLC